ncbi:hypothetical protein R3P38DRAFT_2493671 [Favolaschia claudopus]|uniref:F-box domain-containing protein n=1 Tax=Favolaschia claudopus TaxID=2862362 RepID=A0AAW0ECV8_9AGAR
MLETLPVELIGKILGDLHLLEVIKMSQLSRRLRLVTADPILNVWRLPILRNLRSEEYEESLKHLSVYTTVPRHNWVEILSMARATYILFETTLPNLKDAEWEDAFSRRFLPSWRKWRKDSNWKTAFLRLLYQTWHRSSTSCTTNEAWTKYIVLNRNGTANLLEASSRGFSPTLIFDDIRLQQNMLHLEMRARVVVQFADIRVVALGTLNLPRSSLTVNSNAKALLAPSCIRTDDAEMPLWEYSYLNHPLPAQTHIEYPFNTPGGADDRRALQEEAESEGLEWVGGLMLVTQIIAQEVNAAPLQSEQPQHEILGGRQQYASFAWEDLWAVAPWLEEKITKQIDGPGLGL